MDRRPRLSSAQWEQLVGFLEQNPQMARGYTRSTQARQQAQQMWEQLTVLLNSEGGGVTKELKSWCKFWNDYKCKLKKKVQDITSSLRGTGGGPPLEECLSNIEIRLLAVLGENFGGQLQGVAVEPFPSGNQVPLQDAEIIVLDNQNLMPIEEPLITLAIEPDYQREEVTLSAPPIEPPADQPPPSVHRVSGRGPGRQRRVRQKNRPQTTFDDAKNLLANIEAKRVEAEQRNAESLAEMVKLLSRKTDIDERAIAMQEKIAKELATSLNNLAESIKASYKKL